MTLLNKATLAVMPARCPLSHSFTRGTGNTIGPSLPPGLLRQEAFTECLKAWGKNSDFSGQGVLLWNTVLLPSILFGKKKISSLANTFGRRISTRGSGVQGHLELDELPSEV